MRILLVLCSRMHAKFSPETYASIYDEHTLTKDQEGGSELFSLNAPLIDLGGTEKHEASRHRACPASGAARRISCLNARTALSAHGGAELNSCPAEAEQARGARQIDQTLAQLVSIRARCVQCMHPAAAGAAAESASGG